MALAPDIVDAIHKNLSHEVGEVLRRRLDKAEKDEKDLATAQDQLLQFGKRTRELEAKLKTDEEFTATLAKIKQENDKLDGLKLRESIIRLKEDQCVARIDDHKTMVALVFANNRYKYHVKEEHNGFQSNPNGMSTHGNGTKTTDQTVEG